MVTEKLIKKRLKKRIREKAEEKVPFITPLPPAFKPEPIPEEQQPVDRPAPPLRPGEVFKDPQTGETTGIVSPSGQIFLGSPQQLEPVSKLAARSEDPLEKVGTQAGQQAQAEFRAEDIGALKRGVAEEEAGLEPSEIQKFSAALPTITSQKLQIAFNQDVARLIKDEKFSRADAEIIARFRLDMLPVDRVREITTLRVLSNMDRIFGGIGGDLIGTSVSEAADVLADRKDLNELTATMSEAASLLPAIEGVVGSGGISPQRALAQLNRAEKDAKIIDQIIQEAALTRPSIVLTGEYLAMRVELEVLIADLADARSTALEKLREEDPQFNLAETRAYLREFEGGKK